MSIPKYLQTTSETVTVEETKTFTPHLKLLSALSKELKKSSDKYIPSAEEGMFSCDGEVFKKFSFVIMDHSQIFKVWKEGMPIGTFEKEEEAEALASSPDGIGSEVKLHKDFAIKFTGPDKMAGRNAILSFGRGAKSGKSKMVTAQKLLREMGLNFKKSQNKDGVGADITSFVYTYTSELASSGGNDYWVFKLQEDKQPVYASEALYIQAKQDLDDLKALQAPEDNLLAEGEARGI